MTGVSGLNHSTSPRSLFVLCRTGTTVDAYDVAFTGDTSSFQCSRIQASSTGTTWQASDGTYDNIGGTVAANTTYGVGYAVEGATVVDYLYVNGALASTNSTGRADGTIDRLYLGGYKGQDGAWWNGSLGYAIWWNRLVPAAVYAALQENPWQIFAADPGRIYFGAGATGGVYEIDAQPGGYSVNGTAATLARGLVVDAQPGAYTLSGTAATLARGYYIDAQPGAYAVNGTAATLARGLVVNAGPGTFTLTGIAATLEKVTPGVYTIDAQPGTFALNGIDATLTYTPLNAYTLDAQPATFTISGADATLVYAGSSIWTDIGVSATTWGDVGGATSIWTDL